MEIEPLVTANVIAIRAKSVSPRVPRNILAMARRLPAA
jgi:hypothetical protein